MVPEYHIYLLEKVLNDLLFRITFKQPIEARHLAGVLGKIQALKRSHGSIVSILSRASQHKLGKEVLEKGWETSIELNEDCFNELIFLKQQLFVTNGQLIRNSLSAGKIFELEEVKKTVEIISKTSEKVDNLFVSDASESSAFIFCQCFGSGSVWIRIIWSDPDPDPYQETIDMDPGSVKN